MGDYPAEVVRGIGGRAGVAERRDVVNLNVDDQRIDGVLVGVKGVVLVDARTRFDCSDYAIVPGAGGVRRRTRLLCVNRERGRIAETGVGICD